MFDLDFDLDFDFGVGDHLSGPDGTGCIIIAVVMGAAVAIVSSGSLPVILIAVCLFLTLLFAPKSKKKIPDLQKLLLLLSVFGLIVSSCWGAQQFQEYQKKQEELRIEQEIEAKKQEEENQKLGVLRRAKTWLMGTEENTENNPETVSVQPAVIVEPVKIDPAPITTQIETAPVTSQNENANEDQNSANQEGPSILDRIKGWLSR